MDSQLSTENNRKEEILAKSRQAQVDEGVEYSLKEGIKLGHKYSFFLLGVLLWVSLISAQLVTFYALWAISSAQLMGESWVKYRHLGEKKYLINGVISGVSFMLLALFFWQREMGRIGAFAWYIG